MPDYIDIEDIPGHGNLGGKYPWEEWANIPEGKALEVTEFLNGSPSSGFTAGNRHTAQAYGLRLMKRGERAYVVKEKQP